MFWVERIPQAHMLGVSVADLDFLTFECTSNQQTPHDDSVACPVPFVPDVSIMCRNTPYNFVAGNRAIYTAAQTCGSLDCMTGPGERSSKAAGLPGRVPYE